MPPGPGGSGTAAGLSPSPAAFPPIPAQPLGCGSSRTRGGGLWRGRKKTKPRVEGEGELEPCSVSTVLGPGGLDASPGGSLARRELRDGAGSLPSPGSGGGTSFPMPSSLLLLLLPPQKKPARARRGSGEQTDLMHRAPSTTAGGPRPFPPSPLSGHQLRHAAAPGRAGAEASSGCSSPGCAPGFGGIPTARRGCRAGPAG